MEQPKYDVFLSYSRKDYVDANNNVIPDNVVSKVKAVLKQAGISYWFDEEGIYSGDNFVEKIVNNIDASQIFVFLSTDNANKSPWTCKEIASAHALGKYIIPVRIDESRYNKKVLFYLADIDFVDYSVNPEKGLECLIESIKNHLAEVKEEEQRKLEDENRRKEEERKKTEELKRQKEQEARQLQEEQDKLIADIEKSCKMLNNEETKIELERSNLLLKADGIVDKERREALKEKIEHGSPNYQRYQKLMAESAKEIQRLKHQVYDSIKKNDVLVNAIKQLKTVKEDVKMKKESMSYVDLGLSVKWATCNLGASSPEEYGDYYAWGEVKPRRDDSWNYDWKTTPYCKRGDSYDNIGWSKYTGEDGKTVLDPADDAATVALGYPWRMPTLDEIMELKDKCTWTWTKMNGNNGYKVVGPNGNSIFLPVAGWCAGSSLSRAGMRGYYWSSSLYTSYPYDAYGLYFNSDDHDWSNYRRYRGRSVRPVRT